MSEMPNENPLQNQDLETVPLQSLYGSGVDVATFNPEDPRLAPLAHTIEEAIVSYCERADRIPTGGSILLTVKQLGMNPETPSNDELGKAIQSMLRICLGLNNYSRQNVKGALRVVARSVDNHTSDGGIDTYLNFIRQFLRPGRKR